MELDESELLEFKAEAEELLQDAEDHLLKMESPENFEKNYSTVFRSFHGLKGAAGMLDLRELKEHVHKLESIFQEQQSRGSLTTELASFFLRGVDGARALLRGESISFDYQLPAATPTAPAAKVEEKRDTAKPRVFVIDDEEDNLEIMQAMLKGESFEAEFFSDPRQALARAAEASPDLVLTDMKMPHLSGMDVHKALKAMDPDLPVIFISGYLDKATLIEALNLGVLAVVEKPFKTTQLITYIGQALHKRETWKLLNRSIDLILFQLNDMERFLVAEGRSESVKMMKEDTRLLLNARRALRSKST